MSGRAPLALILPAVAFGSACTLGSAGTAPSSSASAGAGLSGAAGGATTGLGGAGAGTATGGHGGTASGGGGGGGRATGGGGSGAGGACGCASDADCGASSACVTHTCAACVCVFELVAEGTPVAAQTPGDCLVSVCDAKGVVVVVADPSDGPSDGDDCTADVCVGGVPEHPLEPAKSPCGQGYVCDGLGACVECVDAGQCASRVCVKGACLPPTCNDSVENGAETDVDCGGGCAPCGQGQSCKTGGDCTTSWCDAGVCQVATSCATLHAAEPLLPDGAYPIDPDGDPVSLGLGMPFPAYCDMTTDGGGFTLMATLRTTNAFQPKAKPGWAGAWSDDWFVNDHGDPTDPGASWVNRDARRFRPLVGPTTVLRASTPKGAVSRYHFGFTQADWDLWNASRTTANGINVIGVFDLANTLVSTSVALTNPKAAQVNGHFYNGTFYLGTAPNDADNDSEGLAARFHVGSNASPSFGYAGDVRGDVAWSLWLR